MTTKSKYSMFALGLVLLELLVGIEYDYNI
jgi:hypothetical protein